MNCLEFKTFHERNQFLKIQAKKLSQYPYFVLLQTVNKLNEFYNDFDFILGSTSETKDINIYDFDKKKWLLGGFSYSLKAQIETKCPNILKTSIPFPDIAFFEPEIIIYVKSVEPLKVHYEGTIDFHEFEENSLISMNYQSFEPSISPKEYHQNLQKIFDYLKKGDIYEVNFAVEYLIKELEINPLNFFNNLTHNSPTPQSGILKWNENWLICASQERFLKKKNDLLISQPIKGTIKKSQKIDFQNVLDLYYSHKNRSENVMIVDLVRNDLNKVCEPNSVHVERLFQIQTYSYLHQMVSTIIGKPQKNISNFDIIQSLFPAGSMTGCPKIRAMQIIEELEKNGRGIYSGSIGYFYEGNFDLNVVIRSLVWNERKKLGSFHVGGAITLNSDWESEFHECQIKAKAILKTLGL